MKDFIEKLISRLEEESYEIYLDGYIASTQKKIIEFTDAIEIVNQLAEEYKGGWIACSERLPEADGYYLVTTDGIHNDVVDIARYEVEDCYWGKYSKILAWMPLPEHYKGE